MTVQTTLFDLEPVQGSLDLDDGRAYARGGDPDTSWDAARSVSDIRASQRAVYMVLATAGGRAGLIDSELVDTYQQHAKAGRVAFQSSSGIRTRRSELVELGAVVDTGDRRRTASGRMSIVWRTAP